MVVVAGIYSILERLFSRKGKIAAAILPRVFFIVFLPLFYHAVFYVLEPGVEIFFRGWSFHFAGLGKLHFDLNHLVALFTPVFDLWLGTPRGVKGQFAQFTLIPSYLGLFLASLALFSIFSLKKSRGTLAFFWFFTILMLGLLFGIPGFNWFLALPFVNRLQNFRYFQPILALLVCILAGFGLEQIRKGQNLKIYFLILAALMLWLAAHLVRFRETVFSSPPAFMPIGLLMLSLAGLCLLHLSRRHLSGKVLAGIVSVFASAELFLCFVLIAPFYGPEAFKIQKPAFLDRVKLDTHQYRFYSPDKAILPPNTASLWGLRDLRDGATLLPREYYRFFSTLNHWESQEQAVDAFLQNGRFYLPLELERIPARGQDLLFKYLLTSRRLGAESLLEQFRAGALLAPGPRYLSQTRYRLEPKTRNGILLHPPARLRALEKIPAGQLVFEIGLLAAADSKSDGAEYLIRARTDSGSRLLFYRFLPAAEAARSGWKEYHLQVSEPAALELATLAGPQANNLQDFALFGSLERTGPTDPNYRLLDDSGPFLYERPFAVPRFFPARNVEWVPDQDRSLELIRQGQFSPEKIFLAGKNPTPGLEPNPSDPAPRDQIRLLRDETDLVELELSFAEPAWLIMTDSFICGWEALLDGGEEKIYPANYYFRAVYVPAGSHNLKFRYHPASFRIGLFKNLGFFIAGIFFTLALIFRKTPWFQGLFPSQPPPG